MDGEWREVDQRLVDLVACQHPVGDVEVGGKCQCNVGHDPPHVWIIPLAEAIHIVCRIA
jgi:hypothetical protein